MASRLTKKQKKASEFRNRKRNQDNEELDVPIIDLEDHPDASFRIPPVLNEGSKSAKKDESRLKQINGSTVRKRKREEDEDPKDVIMDENPKPSNERITTGEQPEKKKKKMGDKYILFVGNLGFKTSVESISNHFSACDPPPTIRLLTSKGRTVNGINKPDKPKGCAFLEFSKASGLQTALRLHHSELDGRRINVELSAGGGGKSETRLKKLQSKNAKLEKHRSTVPVEPIEGENPGKPTAKTRHSTTSGIKAELTTKQTWSVPKDGEVTARGGQRHRKSSKMPGADGSGRHNRRPSRPARAISGANAIPLG